MIPPRTCPPKREARRWKRALLIAAIVAAIITITTWPWSTFMGHSHWQLVEWVPFTHGIRPFDILANVALFVPLGWALGRSGARRTIPLIVLGGALLSMSIELYQVYCHGHFPTMTDVLTNTCGTAIGALLKVRSRT